MTLYFICVLASLWVNQGYWIASGVGFQYGRIPGLAGNSNHRWDLSDISLFNMLRLKMVTELSEWCLEQCWKLWLAKMTPARNPYSNSSSGTWHISKLNFPPNPESFQIESLTPNSIQNPWFTPHGATTRAGEDHKSLIWRSKFSFILEIF